MLNTSDINWRETLVSRKSKSSSRVKNEEGQEVGQKKKSQKDFNCHDLVRKSELFTNPIDGPSCRSHPYSMAEGSERWGGE